MLCDGLFFLLLLKCFDEFVDFFKGRVMDLCMSLKMWEFLFSCSGCKFWYFVLEFGDKGLFIIWGSWVISKF